MLDFSFSELAVIGAVALVVLGPERLPRVARTAGQWISKAQRYVNDVKADIQRESELAELKKLQQQVQQSATEMESALHQNLSSIESELGRTAQQASASLSNDGDGSLRTPDYDRLLEQGDRYDDGFHTRADFVKPQPTLEELAARLELLQHRLGPGAAPRFKYAPRARARRLPTPARRDRPSH